MELLVVMGKALLPNGIGMLETCFHRGVVMECK